MLIQQVVKGVECGVGRSIKSRFEEFYEYGHMDPKQNYVCWTCAVDFFGSELITYNSGSQSVLRESQGIRGHISIMVNLKFTSFSN